MILKLRDRLNWWAKQRAAGRSRYYGDGGTIHATGTVDIEIFEGRVVSVWYRCQLLPFTERWVDEGRAAEMAGASANVEITALHVKDL